MKRIKYIILILTISFFSLIISSCASVDKKGVSYNLTVDSCRYNSSTNTTTIVWNSTLTNDSIYDMKDVFFQFDLYRNGEKIGTTKTLYWDIEIKHGESNFGNRNFVVNGIVDDIKINCWNATYDSLWNTYKAWWILTIIGVVILFIVILYCVVEYEDLDWIGTIVGVGIPIVALLLIIGFSLGWVEKNWFAILIVVGGIIAELVLYLIAEIIRIIIESEYKTSILISGAILICLIGGLLGFVYFRSFRGLFIIGAVVFVITILVEIIKKKLKARENSGNNEIKDKRWIEKWLEEMDIKEDNEYDIDIEDVDYMTVEELREFCSDNEIRGYSRLRKSDLVSLVKNYLGGKNEEETHTADLSDNVVHTADLKEE